MASWKPPSRCHLEGFRRAQSLTVFFWGGVACLVFLKGLFGCLRYVLVSSDCLFFFFFLILRLFVFKGCLVQTYLY